MRPRIIVPTEGRRGPEGREMERVGCFEVFGFLEGEERMGPGMLAQRCGPEMWVPGPMLFVFEGPRICPGSAIFCLPSVEICAILEFLLVFV